VRSAAVAREDPRSDPLRDRQIGPASDPRWSPVTGVGVRRAAEAVGETLAAHGVRHAFGLIGSGNFLVVNALAASGVEFLSARHEGAAIVMADAYARVSGEVGVCSVHQGPGLTNATTGLVEAVKSRTPLVVLAGEMPAGALRANLKIDQASLVSAVGAGVDRLRSPATAAADAARALWRARVERRPIVLMLPIDVEVQPAPDGQAAPPAAPPPAPVPAPEAITALADLCAGARQAAIVAGRGAVLAGARAPLDAVAERLGALVATSAVANGFFAGHPRNVGISGGFASPLAQELLPQADLVLSFGASLNPWTTRYGRLIGDGARVVQVDRDADAVGAFHPVDFAVYGDAAGAASALAAELQLRGVQLDGFRAEEPRIAAYRRADDPYEDAGGDGCIDPRTLSIALDELLPAERTLAVDSGHFMGWPAMYLRVPDAAGFVFTQAFQSVGLGLASAIGAAVARPDRLTVAALGDGGAFMALAEIETAVRAGLPLLIVVYDDAAYGAEVHHFAPDGEPFGLVRFPDADLAAAARGLGAEGLTVRAPEDLGGVRDWLARRERPLVVDAKVVPHICAEWLEEAFRGG
jgi:thiamine pyrophosphate-dependent acetolactate synthase large subunit-like protein